MGHQLLQQLTQRSHRLLQSSDLANHEHPLAVLLVLGHGQQLITVPPQTLRRQTQTTQDQRIQSARQGCAVPSLLQTLPSLT